MATIPNEVIREQRVKVEYILALYNKSVHAVKRVNPHAYMWVDIETTVSTLVPDAVPRHHASITKAVGANGPDCIEFELTDQQFSTMNKLVAAMETSRNPLNTTGDPRFQMKCDPELKDLPDLLLSNDLNDMRFSSKLASKTYAFYCPCGRGYFCNSIRKIFFAGTDILHWKKKIGIPTLNSTIGFCIGVPIADYVLYSVPVETSIRIDWNDNKVVKFMTYGLTEDVTLFYDDPIMKMHHVSHKVEFHMLQERIEEVNQFVERAKDTGIVRGIPLMGDGPLVNACGGKKHTYGTNQKFLEFMKSHPDSVRIAAACFSMYSMCPICYRNANPAFSLLPDLF